MAPFQVLHFWTAEAKSQLTWNPIDAECLFCISLSVSYHNLYMYTFCDHACLCIQFSPTFFLSPVFLSLARLVRSQLDLHLLFPQKIVATCYQYQYKYNNNNRNSSNINNNRINFICIAPLTTIHYIWVLKAANDKLHQVIKNVHY